MGTRGETDLKNLGVILESQGYELKQKTASYDIADNDITGGRKIVETKSNQLFTGRFEERDIKDFMRVWETYPAQYQGRDVSSIEAPLRQICDSMMMNYRGEVCPLEAMLYTSNIISSQFGNFKLTEAVANVVYRVWRRDNNSLSSIRHIVDVWKWDHVINICAVAMGKICASVPDSTEPARLLRYILDCHGDREETRRGCFVGILESKREEFIPDIYYIIHDLKGTDADKIIGNLFKNKFSYYYPESYGQMDVSIFNDSTPYVRDLVKKTLMHETEERTLVGRYKKAASAGERHQIIEEGLELVRQGKGKGIYDAVNMLKSVGDREVSQRMYAMLDLRSRNNGVQQPIISYFGGVSYGPAIQDMKAVDKNNENYASCRVVLYKRGEITGDQLMSGFLSEEGSKQIQYYLSGFGGLQEKTPDVKNGAFRYFCGHLNDGQLKCAIRNYEQLVRKYKHLYNAQVGDLFKEYMGFETAFGTVQIRMAEQDSCLKIIDMIMDSSNKKKYEDFLYYVAEQGEFSGTIANRAREILRKHGCERIKA